MPALYESFSSHSGFQILRWPPLRLGALYEISARHSEALCVQSEVRSFLLGTNAIVSIYDELPIDAPSQYQILRCGREGMIKRRSLNYHCAIWWLCGYKPVGLLFRQRNVGSKQMSQHARSSGAKRQCPPQCRGRKFAYIWCTT